MRRLCGALALVVLAGCAGDASEVLVERAPGAAAMVALPEGGLIYGERRSGRILTEEGEVVARVEVTAEGQRGLVGLAVDERGGAYASFTRPDGRMVVAQVAPGEERTVWVGPRSARIGNGGHIAFAPDGTIVVGIGDLEDPGSASDLSAPNGKLLRIDPAGPPEQQWDLVSSGWNNPFAFTFTPSGALWLADNAPGTQEERLLRADPVGPRTVLPERTAPSGLAAVDDETLVLCGYRTQVLQRYRIGGDRVARPEGGPLARDCRYGVVALSDGRIAYASDDAIKTIRP